MNYLYIANIITDLLSVIGESKPSHNFNVVRNLAQKAEEIIVLLKNSHEEQQNKEQKDAIN